MKFRDYSDAHNSGDYCTCKDVRQGDTKIIGTRIVHSKLVSTGQVDWFDKPILRETGCKKPIIIPVNMRND